MDVFNKNSRLTKVKRPTTLKEFELMILRSWNENHLENHF